MSHTVGTAGAILRELGRLRSMRYAAAFASALLLSACGTATTTSGTSASVTEQDCTQPPEDTHRCMVCEIGNDGPAEGRTVIVDEKDKHKHLKHGSYMGPCHAEDRCAAAGSRPVFGGDNANGFVRAGKVAICHIPPGNPGNAHTIVVGEPAVSAHLAHGDHIGFCSEPVCERPAVCSCGCDCKKDCGTAADNPNDDEECSTCDDDTTTDDTTYTEADMNTGVSDTSTTGSSDTSSSTSGSSSSDSSCPAGISACTLDSDCGTSGWVCYSGCCLAEVTLY